MCSYLESLLLGMQGHCVVCIVCDSLVVQLMLFLDACVAIWNLCCLECRDTCVVCIVCERLVSQLMLFMDACVAIYRLCFLECRDTCVVCIV